jgi:outer membrane immunogenic protein
MLAYSQFVGGDPMKKLLLAGTALAFAGPALGADLPVKAPVSPVSYFSWTGCYVGGHAGYGWGRTSFFGPDFTSESVRDDISGPFVGGQVGCNYQLSGNWVVGVEGSLSSGRMRGDVPNLSFVGPFLPFSDMPGSKSDLLGSATGRIGYAWDRTLLYLTAGGAWDHNRYEVVFPFADIGASEVRVGLTAGVGIEWAFLDKWSARIQFDYYGFPRGGNDAVLLMSDPTHPVFTDPASVVQRIETVTLGINYHFESTSAPVVAKY